MLSLGFVLLTCFTVSHQLPAFLLEHGDDENRIYGGRLAKKGEFPWMVTLFIKSPDGTMVTCGGFVISKTHVMTAAHCVCKDATTKQYVNVTDILGKIGHVNIMNATKVEFDAMHVHEDYDEIHHDISILRLKIPINKFGKNIQRICIAKKGKKYANRQAVVQMGWGGVDNETSGTLTLKTTSLGQILDRKTCIREMSSDVEPGLLCVSNASGEKICEGDSGGPLCIINGTDKLAVGILSFDFYDECMAGNDLPSMHTDIGYNARWIKNTIKDKGICWKS